jgi:hypothetical protein
MTTHSAKPGANTLSQPRREIDLRAAYRIMIDVWLSQHNLSLSGKPTRERSTARASRTS